MLRNRQGFYSAPKNKYPFTSNPRPIYGHFKKPFCQNELKCFNCNSSHHLMRDFKKTSNLNQNVNASLKDIPRKENSVLFKNRE